MTDGIDLYYTSFGEGEPVIAVHGGPGLDHQYLAMGCAPLVETHHMVYYDQRCLGQSGGIPTPDTVTFDAFIADLEVMRSGFGFEKVNIIAHSWGALVAIAYASRFPETLRSLVLITPSPVTYVGMLDVADHVQNRISPSDRDLLGPLTTSEPFLFGEEEPVNTFMRLWFKAYLGDPTNEWLLNFHLTARSAKNWSRVYALMLRDLGRFNLLPELGKIRAPTLVIQGGKDVVPAQHTDDIVSHLSLAKKVVIAESGHFPFLEAPDSLFPAVRAFLDSPNS